LFSSDLQAVAQQIGAERLLRDQVGKGLPEAIGLVEMSFHSVGVQASPMPPLWAII
jgi:hypothetical protein